MLPGLLSSAERDDIEAKFAVPGVGSDREGQFSLGGTLPRRFITFGEYASCSSGIAGCAHRALLAAAEVTVASREAPVGDAAARWGMASCAPGPFSLSLAQEVVYGSVFQVLCYLLTDDRLDSTLKPA